jgi:tripartite-type tricarboxylate transporter receptor subunit TctC
MLNEAINEGMRSPEIQTLIANLGSESRPNSPAEFAAYIAVQHGKWVEVGKAAGVKLN